MASISLIVFSRPRPPISLSILPNSSDSYKPLNVLVKELISFSLLTVAVMALPITDGILLLKANLATDPSLPIAVLANSS